MIFTVPDFPVADVKLGKHRAISLHRWERRSQHVFIYLC